MSLLWLKSEWGDCGSSRESDSFRRNSEDSIELSLIIDLFSLSSIQKRQTISLTICKSVSSIRMRSDRCLTSRYCRDIFRSYYVWFFFSAQSKADSWHSFLLISVESFSGYSRFGLKTWERRLFGSTAARWHRRKCQTMSSPNNLFTL